MRTLVTAFLTLVCVGAMEIDVVENMPLIVAHRGASAQAPENTLAAFREGFALGADRIEGDFRITSDGQVVCIHDETTGRTTGDAHDLVVRDSVLAQLKHLDVGTWKDPKYANEPIPTLEEVLQSIPAGKGAVIELKGGPLVSKPSALVVKASGVGPDRLAFIAFDAETLTIVKQAAPNYQAWYLSGFKLDEATGAWTPTAQELITTARRIKADGLDVKANPDVVNEEFVKEVRDAGLSLHVYTVDDPLLARRMMELGVDSITTNTPGKIRKALKADG